MPVARTSSLRGLVGLADARACACAHARGRPQARNRPTTLLLLARLEQLVANVVHALVVALLHRVEQHLLVEIVPVPLLSIVEGGDVDFGAVDAVLLRQQLVEDGLQAPRNGQRELVRPGKVETLAGAKNVHNAVHGALNGVGPAFDALGERGAGPRLDLLPDPERDGHFPEGRLDGLDHARVLRQRRHLGRLERCLHRGRSGTVGVRVGVGIVAGLGLLPEPPAHEDLESVLSVRHFRPGLLLSLDALRVELRVQRQPLEEALHGRHALRQAGEDVEIAPHPSRQARLARRRLEALVHQDDGAVVVLVPDAPAECLVQGAERLLLVPPVASQQMTLLALPAHGAGVVVVLLCVDLGVLQVGVRDAHDDDGARVLVRKVEALRDLAPTDGEKHSAGPVVDPLVVLVHGLLEGLPAARPGLLDVRLETGHGLEDARLLPPDGQLVHHVVGREEDEQAVGNRRAHGEDDFPDAVHKLGLGRLLVGGLQGQSVRGRREHAGQDLLLHVDDVRRLQGHRELGPQLGRKRVERRQRSRGQHDRVRLGGDRPEDDARVQAPQGHGHDDETADRVLGDLATSHLAPVLVHGPR